MSEQREHATRERQHARMFHNIRRRVRQWEQGGRDGRGPGIGPPPVTWVIGQYGVSRERAEALIAAALAAGPERTQE